MAALGLAAALGGCAGAPVFERLPEGLGGLPADAPAQPTTPYQYPAVHDMPPERTTKPMSEEELYNAEQALKAARDRQEKQEAADKGPTAAKQKAVPAAKKKPVKGKNDGTEGAETGAKTNP